MSRHVSRLGLLALQEVDVVWEPEGDTFHLAGCRYAPPVSVAAHTGSFADAADHLMRPCLTCVPAVATVSTIQRAWIAAVRLGVARFAIRAGIHVPAAPQGRAPW